MKVGDKVIVKDNLQKELLNLKFDFATSKNMAKRFVGTVQEVLALWIDKDSGQEYASVDLCCEIPVQCLKMVPKMKLYAARDKNTGKLVTNLTSPSHKFWHRRGDCEKAIRNYNDGHRWCNYDLELVIYELVEVKE